MGGGGMLRLVAYGDEANFSYPPRPENRATPWNIEWEVKVRHRSTTGGILGQSMDFGGGGGAGRGGPPQGAQGQQQQPAPTPGRPSAGDVLRGLGGLGGLRLPGR